MQAPQRRLPLQSRRPSWSAATVLCVALSQPVLAGSLEVRVHDDDGAPIAGQGLGLTVLHVAASPPQLAHRRTRGNWGRTGRDGRVRFEGLPPGQYGIELSRLGDPTLVPPALNPYVTLPKATLTSDDERVTIDVELWRGVVVVTRMDVDHGDPRGRLVFRELDHGDAVPVELAANAYRELALVPGRWEVALDPPPGYLLTDLDVDGRSLEGSTAELQLVRGTPPRHVTWSFNARAWIAGKVDFDGRRVGAEVVATLLEPGPWVEAAERRGGSAVRDVSAYPDSRDGDRYRMTVPDGTWSVRVVGPEVESVEPESIEMTLAPGEQGRADFLVRPTDAGGRPVLMVSVRGPGGERLDEAIIGIWTADRAQPGEPPLARARTRSYLPSRFSGLDEGSYVVAAAHPDFLEASVRLDDFKPDPGEPRWVTVRLERALRLHAMARDAEARPVAGVHLRLQRRDRDDPWLVRDDARLESARRSPRAVTDSTGHAWIAHLRPGDYEARGELEGARARERFVRFEDGDRLQRTVALRARQSDTELSLRVLPAARFSGSLFCADGRKLPASASLLALPAEVEIEDRDVDELVERAALDLRDEPLRGSLRDRFLAGPLEEGLYRLAVRPAGFDRWTWLPGSEWGADSELLQATLGRPTDLGPVRIDCGPVVLLLPQLASAEPLPDLRSAIREYGRPRIEGTVLVDGESIGPRGVRSEVRREKVALRGLPEGEADLQVSIVHPYFLPGPELVVAVEGELEFGRLLAARAALAAVGGQIRVRTGDAVAVRLTSEASEARLAPVEGGLADLPSVAPGVYGLEECADAACERILRAWRGVRVEPARTVTLP